MKLLLSLCLAACIALTSSCHSDGGEDTTTISVAGLYSLTGNWSSLGITSQEAMRLAQNDINTQLAARGSNIRFASVVYDTQLDANAARADIQAAFAGRGIQLVLGPQSSAEVGAVRSYADEHGVLVVSQGSTASTLALPDDAVFRFCPGDGPEGDAMSRTMYAAGKRMMITLARDDAGNLGLQESVNARFAALGGQVDALLPYAANTTDFTAVIQQLQTRIAQHVAALGANQVGVYLASFDECVTLFRAAVGNTVLRSVPWYGGDGVVQSAALLNDADARTFAMATSFFAPNFGLPALANPRMASLVDEIRTATGIEPDAYALSVYDAMWVIARTVANAPQLLGDFAQLKLSFEIGRAHV